MKKKTAGARFIAPIYILLIVFLIASCDNTTEPLNPPLPCTALPYDTTNQGIIPIEPYKTVNRGALSPDGKTLAYNFAEGTIWFLDLDTRVQTKLVVDFPENISPLSVGSIHWCPYNSDLLLVNAWTYVDTVGDGKKYILTDNIYIVDRKGTIVRRVTPKKYPKWGAPEISAIAWLHGSTPEADSIFITPGGIYIPQDDKFVEPNIRPFTVSQDGRYWYGVYANEPFNSDNKINGIPLLYSGYDIHFRTASFSPTGKYLALAANISTWGTEYLNLIILDIETWLQNPSEPAPIVSAINFEERYCMYTTRGAYPVFLTENSLAVSMFPAYATYGHYYEITIDGRMVRQLSQDL